jgi:hypothetical protein
MPRLPAFETIRLLIVAGYLRLLKRTIFDTGFNVYALISVNIYNAVVWPFNYCPCRTAAYARGIGAMAATHCKREKHGLPLGFINFGRAPSDGAGFHLIPVFARDGTRIAAQTLVLIKYKRSSHYLPPFARMLTGTLS